MKTNNKSLYTPIVGTLSDINEILDEMVADNTPEPVTLSAPTLDEISASLYFVEQKHGGTQFWN